MAKTESDYIRQGTHAPVSEIADQVICGLPDSIGEITDEQFSLLVAERRSLGRMLDQDEALAVLKVGRENLASVTD